MLAKNAAKEVHKDLFSVICFSMFSLMVFFILSKLSSLQIMRLITLFHMQVQIVKLYLEMEADKYIWWFVINCMKANADKFHAILLNCEGEGSKWMLHRAKRRSDTARSEIGQSASF